ncbi:MAG: hypothetical protein KatS3mg068_2564 [Candidatus Sericytochromatia bacterium]|nr:MAG: hypothetical protein KatS3mg068_2564 [Candidatus Sericytochromatia bacterium]
MSYFQKNLIKLFLLVPISYIFISIIKNVYSINDLLYCYSNRSNPGCKYYFFLHNVNLPIHEFGHLFFFFLGDFISILGGSLFQIIIPLSFSIYFLISKDLFSFGIVNLWLGQSLLSVAHYIWDGKLRLLPLITNNEDTHDWYNLLSMLGLLNYSNFFGKTLAFLSCLFIIINIILCFYIVFKEGKFIEIKK